MKISYQATVDEVTDAIVRRHEVSGLITRRKWQALVFFILYFIIYWLVAVQKAATAVNTIGAVLAAVIGYGVFLLFIKRLVRGSVRRFVVKTQASSIPVEYQLDESGVVYQEVGREKKFSWDSLTAINQTEESIELINEQTFIAVIYKRAFKDQEQLNELLTFIEKRASGGNHHAGGPA